MRKTVFISSTFIDLKEERKEVWECLEKFDVIVKGMEQFGAREFPPLVTCMTEVEQSDIYVGIIGMRYGSEDENSDKSFTQLEYERAVELEKTIFIYLIDEENSKVTPSLIQLDRIKKLNSFKKILKENHTVDTFSNSQDLVSKLQRKFKEVLTPKKEAIIEDEYENTKKILDLFFLVPAVYSGREIKLKVQFIGQPKSASKEICKTFNYEFGKTIINRIKIIYPLLELENLKSIFIEFKHFDDFIALDKELEYEIFANVLFKETKAKSLTTVFQDKIETVYDERLCVSFESNKGIGFGLQKPKDVLIEGDGQVALVLKDIEKHN